MKRISTYFKYVLLYIILAFYLFILYKILLFKYISPLELYGADRLFSRTINIVPMKSILGYLSDSYFSIKVALMNIIGNIVIFIPMGIYFQMLKKNKSVFKSVVIICFISLSVEIIQYIFGIGGSDIDDVILNTIGGLLGILTYKMIALLFKNENKTRTAITFLSLATGIFCIIYSINFYPQLLGVANNTEIITLGKELGVNDKEPDIIGDFIGINENLLTVKNYINEYGDKYDSMYENGEINILIDSNTRIIKKTINFNYGHNQILVTYESLTLEQLVSLKPMIEVISCLHVAEENGYLIAKDLYVFYEVE